jgi:hypothetical protein
MSRSSARVLVGHAEAGQSKQHSESSSRNAQRRSPSPWGRRLGTAPIPGTVEAEAYDLGGQGVGYSVTSVNGSSGYGYRNDAVDLENTSDSSGTYDLGWTGSASGRSTR